MKSFVSLVILILSVTCARAADAPKSKTFEEILKLKQMGFSDQEIKATAERTGTTLDLSAPQVQQLKDVGAGDDLIKALRPKPKAITVQGVLQMAKEGKGSGQIIDALTAAESRPTVETDQAVELAEQGLAVPVLLLLKGRSLGVDEFKALARAKVAAQDLTKLMHYLGVQPKPLNTDDALALTRAGMTEAMVAEIRQHAEEAVAKDEGAQTAPPTPREEVGKGDEPEDGNGQIQREKILKRKLNPPELVGRWEGTMSMAVNVQRASLILAQDGRYTLKVGSGHLEVPFAGTWLIGAGQLTLESDEGALDSLRYELKGRNLLIRSKGGQTYDLEKTGD